jgi:hypothetical protein
MMAAHAAVLTGNDVEIISHMVMSPIGGAQYLHEKIPEIGMQPFTITYEKRGSADGYAMKVYGDAAAPTSWAEFPEGEVEAYSLRHAYRRLWDRYADLIKDHILTPGEVWRYTSDYDLVLCTLPASKMCLHDHEFQSQEVTLVKVHRCNPRNTIIYSGDLEDHWYRWSCIRDEPWLEFSGRVDPEHAVDSHQAVWHGVKPIKSDCTCHTRPDGSFVKLGRFGQWRKAVLVSDAFKDALVALEARHAVL